MAPKNDFSLITLIFYFNFSFYSLNTKKLTEIGLVNNSRQGVLHFNNVKIEQIIPSKLKKNSNY